VVTPTELAALGSELDGMRRSLARRIAVDRVNQSGADLDEAMMVAVRQCEDKWPLITRLIREWAEGEPPC
jgi:hypothetical protein